LIIQGNKTIFSNWEKESWQTFEETSGYGDRNGSTNGPTAWQIYDDYYYDYDDDDDEIGC